MIRLRRLMVAALVGVGLSACAGESDPDSSGSPSSSPSVSSKPRATTGPSEGSTASRTSEPDPEPVYGTPAPARLSIPDLDLIGFAVLPYRGRTDDERGTVIQNDGQLASPHGPAGGTGPGGIGNYQVTGHRLSSTMPFRYLPQLTRGDRVHVESRGVRHVYRIVATRETSFRELTSLRAQRAAVPGRPGVEPTRAMITLSTCATLEDHAEGNFWSDRFGNPEHRIDKIGVLVRSMPLGR